MLNCCNSTFSFSFLPFVFFSFLLLIELEAYLPMSKPAQWAIKTTAPIVRPKKVTCCQNMRLVPRHCWTFHPAHFTVNARHAAGTALGCVYWRRVGSLSSRRGLCRHGGASVVTAAPPHAIWHPSRNSHLLSHSKKFHSDKNCDLPTQYSAFPTSTCYFKR